MEETMNRTISTITTTLLAFAISFGSAGAQADSRRDLVRVHIPIHDHGPETLRLKRLIRKERHMNLDRYRLKAVVVKNGPFSNGFATLRVGNHRSGRFFLPGRERIFIPAPSRADDDWRLRLGPGTQVRMVTAVLEPRRRGHAHRRTHDHYRNRHADRHGDRHHDGLAWMRHQSDNKKDPKRSKKQARRLTEEATQREVRDRSKRAEQGNRRSTATRTYPRLRTHSS